MQKTVSSREFNQDVGRVKKDSLTGPVFITDRGKPSHVLMSIDDYRKITSTNRKISELLSMPAQDYVELEISRNRDLPKLAEFD